MIRTLVSLILLCTLSLIQTTEVPHLLSLTVAQLGDNVTLQCPFSKVEVRFFFWYKQSVGRMVQTVAVQSLDTVTLHGQFNNRRFTVEKGAAEYNLIIHNVIKEDEATYFCQAGTVYEMNTLNGTFLRVNGHNQQKSVYLTQPVTQSVQLGDSVTLQCLVLFKSKENKIQCPGEHDVYWFRAGSNESHPGAIFTHGNRSAECQESPSPQRSCVYSLSKSIMTSADVGTYYCAVATCGEILFGSGTKVDTSTTRPELLPVVIVLGILLACCMIVIAIFIFSRHGRRVCEQCKGKVSTSNHLGHDKSTVPCSSDLDDEAEALNYAALDFYTRKAKRGRKKIESPEQSVYTAAVYSAVRTDRQ